MKVTYIPYILVYMSSELYIMFLRQSFRGISMEVVGFHGTYLISYLLQKISLRSFPRGSLHESLP